MKKLLVVLLAVVMLFGLTYSVLAAPTLPEDMWSRPAPIRDACQKLMDYKIIEGKSDGLMWPEAMLTRAAMALVHFYRRAFSPYIQPRCIYIPTCSSYALEAIARFGAIRGGLLSVWRLLRCNPFSRGGYDPVPDSFTFRRQFHVYPRK